MCDWFVDNKLSIHFGEDKTKSIIFSTKNKVKRAGQLNIKYKNVEIKQHSKVTYLGCILDETLCGESLALHVINKVNTKLKFLYRNNRMLSKPFFLFIFFIKIHPYPRRKHHLKWTELLTPHIGLLTPDLTPSLFIFSLGPSPLSTLSPGNMIM